MLDRKKFRVLRIRGQRRAFSLEPVFWEALEEIATSRGLRLGTVLEEALVSELDTNASSMLRTSSTQWLLDRYRAMRTRDLRRLAQTVVDSIEAPSLVLSSQRHIFGANAAFRSLGRPDVSARLRLAAPMERIVALLREDPARIVQVDGVVEIADRRLPTSVRVAHLEEVASTFYLLCTLRFAPPRS